LSLIFEVWHRTDTKFIDIFCEIVELPKWKRCQYHVYKSLYLHCEVQMETTLLEVYVHREYLKYSDTPEGKPLTNEDHPFYFYVKFTALFTVQNICGTFRTVQSKICIM
jgi:hypothetical protein